MHVTSAWHGLQNPTSEDLKMTGDLTRDLTRLPSIERINSRWQMDKEAFWLIEIPTYLSKCAPAF